MIDIICDYCERKFQNYPSNNRKYCSRKCFELGNRKIYIKVCPQCTEVFIVNAKRKEMKFCSRKCAGSYHNPKGSQTGKLSRTWRGGEFISENGYEMTLIPGTGKYVTKHRHIMEKYLGKKLNKGKILLIGIMYDGITMSLVYFTGNLMFLMILIVFHAIGIPMVIVSRTALIQEWIDDSKLGRVFSLVNVSVIGMTALSAGATGWLADIMPVGQIFGIVGLAAMLCGLVGWFYPGLKES